MAGGASVGARGAARARSEHSHSALSLSDRLLEMIGGRAPDEKNPSELSARRPPPRKVLCPDLVVPADCECTLIMPVIPPAPGRVPIYDVFGHTMLELKVPLDFRGTVGSTAALATPVPSTKDLKSPKREVHLLTEAGDTMGYCLHHKARAADIGRYDIYTSDGARFAYLYSDRGKFTLCTEPGLTFFIMGQYGPPSVNILDGGGSLVASTEVVLLDADHSVDYIKLRVGGGGDTGLMLCALTCFQDLHLMSMAAMAAPTPS